MTAHLIERKNVEVAFDTIQRHEKVEPKLYEKIIKQIRQLMLTWRV